MTVLVGAFNQEKALVGAFSVIVQLNRWIGLQHYLEVQAQGGGASSRAGGLEAVQGADGGGLEVERDGGGDGPAAADQSEMSTEVT